MNNILFNLPLILLLYSGLFYPQKYLVPVLACQNADSTLKNQDTTYTRGIFFEKTFSLSFVSDSDHQSWLNGRQIFSVNDPDDPSLTFFCKGRVSGQLWRYRSNDTILKAFAITLNYSRDSVQINDVVELEVYQHSPLSKKSKKITIGRYPYILTLELDSFASRRILFKTYEYESVSNIRFIARIEKI